MPPTELIPRGQHVMTVCNACRYCEQFCPVFPAVEQRVAFGKADLVYLANLCHNCGECLYACQFAPPHEFAINVPQTLAAIRLRSYEDCCWPRWLAGAFGRNSLVTASALAAAFSGVMLGVTWLLNGTALWRPSPQGDFYSVVPYGVMVGLFGAVAVFVLAALRIGTLRFRREIDGSKPTTVSEATKPTKLTKRTTLTKRAKAEIRGRALRDALTLRHLHATGGDCTSAEEVRSPWRRWFHHATFYGFALCFASTTVAAAYHSIFGWQAPYDYASLPVLLGTAGGLGLVVGPAGLFVIGRRRDPAMGDPAQQGLDDAFVVLLFLVGFTGLLLLALRDTALMGLLLIVHLGTVLALFVSLPYGKFVHGIYRATALRNYAEETQPPTT